MNKGARAQTQQPVLVIMGVSGCGKSTVAGIHAGQAAEIIQLLSLRQEEGADSQHFSTHPEPAPIRDVHGKAEIGVAGLAVMGSNLARNFATKGFVTAIHNRSEAKTTALIADHGMDGEFIPSASAADFVASLATPRKIIIMVKAGGPTDAVIDELTGVPTPGFAAALAYYDGLRSHRLPAAINQGQRDFFGAPTYRRVDRTGTFHTQWSGDRTEVRV